MGLTSRAGVVPISHRKILSVSHGRTVADAAVALGVIQSRSFDGRDPATGGVPLGVARPIYLAGEYPKRLYESSIRTDFEVLCWA